MGYLADDEEKEAFAYLESAVAIALQATCTRAKCGSVVVKNGAVVGRGFNSPAHNEASRCARPKDSYHKKITDKTCCVHAEQRAIVDALRRNPDKLSGARLYFIRLEEGNPVSAGEPYCTICSKMALDVGIIEFVLLHKKGICVYETEEYNNFSFSYKE